MESTSWQLLIDCFAPYDLDCSAEFFGDDLASCRNSSISCSSIVYCKQCAYCVIIVLATCKWLFALCCLINLNLNSSFGRKLDNAYETYVDAIVPGATILMF